MMWRKKNTPERTAEAAYQRGDLIENREVLIQTWANYCCRTEQKVIQMLIAKAED